LPYVAVVYLFVGVGPVVGCAGGELALRRCSTKDGRSH
jgi:hypothetical protein